MGYRWWSGRRDNPLDFAFRDECAVMGFLLAFLPDRTKLYALAALAFVLGLLGWRRAGIKAALERERLDRKLKDYAHADEIEDRVDRSRADPDRLRKYDDAGYRED